MRALLLWLVFGLIVSLAQGITVQYTYTNRQASAGFTVCEMCACNYVTVFAYDWYYDNSTYDINPPYSLYIFYGGYDNCANTSYHDIANKTVHLRDFTILPNARRAYLNETHLVSVGGVHIKLEVDWVSPATYQECDCQDMELIGPDIVKMRSKSSFTQTLVHGYIDIGPARYLFEPYHAIGYIYDYGSKTTTIMSV